MDTLAYVASHGGGSTRRRRDARIAAVLGEFGFTTYVAPDGDDPSLLADRVARVREAAVVVCDLVRPDRDIPIEVAIAATRAIPVLALIPEDAPLDGCAAQLLRDCGATVMRYGRCEPHQVLDATLGELEVEMTRMRGTQRAAGRFARLDARYA
jgi:hypothetical protein